MEENNIADNVAHANAAAAAADEKIQIPVNETETALPFEIDCSDTNQVTLAFFTNPSYYNTLKRAKKEKMPKDDKKHREEIKFYRKRILSLFKDLLKEEQTSEEHKNEELYAPIIKETHESFVNICINHFKIIDKTDIIQAQYGAIDEDILKHNGGHDNANDLDSMDDINIDGFTADNVNHIMMKKNIKISNLDNYVTIINDLSANDTRVIPMKVDIDLRQPNLKTKGVKTKVKKNKAS